MEAIASVHIYIIIFYDIILYYTMVHYIMGHKPLNMSDTCYPNVRLMSSSWA